MTGGATNNRAWGSISRSPQHRGGRQSIVHIFVDEIKSISKGPALLGLSLVCTAMMPFLSPWPLFSAIPSRAEPFSSQCSTQGDAVSPSDALLINSPAFSHAWRICPDWVIFPKAEGRDHREDEDRERGKKTRPREKRENADLTKDSKNANARSFRFPPRTKGGISINPKHPLLLVHERTGESVSSPGPEYIAPNGQKRCGEVQIKT